MKEKRNNYFNALLSISNGSLTEMCTVVYSVEKGQYGEKCLKKCLGLKYMETSKFRTKLRCFGDSSSSRDVKATMK